MDAHLDAGSQGWNNALWQELPSPSFTLHNQVTQCIQTELLRTGQKHWAWPMQARVEVGMGKMEHPVLEALGTGGCVYRAVGIRGNRFSSPHLPAQSGPKDTILKQTKNQVEVSGLTIRSEL